MSVRQLCSAKPDGAVCWLNPETREKQFGIYSRLLVSKSCDRSLSLSYAFNLLTSKMYNIRCRRTHPKNSLEFTETSTFCSVIVRPNWAVRFVYPCTLAIHWCRRGRQPMAVFAKIVWRPAGCPRSWYFLKWTSQLIPMKSIENPASGATYQWLQWIVPVSCACLWPTLDVQYPQIRPALPPSSSTALTAVVSLSGEVLRHRAA